MVDVEISPWIKGIPLAPEYHPTESELSDPITFILRIQEQASQFGICKVVPPASKQPRKSFISNINRCIAEAQGKKKKIPSKARARIKFPARKQALGSPSSGCSSSTSSYTLEDFEAKAKVFARGKLGTTKDVSTQVLESLFWRFMSEDDRETFVEFSDDIPGSAFPPNESEAKKQTSSSGWKLASGPWNLRYVAELQGSLLRFLPGVSSIPGVALPMVYISMLFAWFGWRTEEHELHVLNYLHSGASRSWYGVPPEAAAAFEDVLRVHASDSQDGEARAAGLSPEVLVSNGVPCCRLVQNAGDFVVVFPRSYNLSFSHGFNCGEFCKFPTPSWLKAARQAAAARRLPLDHSPVFCQEQLLYQAALVFSESSMALEVRSCSRLKQKKKLSIDDAIRSEFASDVMKTRQVLEKLQSRCVLLSRSSGSSGDCEKENLCNLVNLETIDSISLLSFVCESMEEKTSNNNSSPILQAPRVEWGSLGCGVCGILCYSCFVIVQPSSEAGRNSSKPPGKLEPRRFKRSSPQASSQGLSPGIFCPEHGLQVSFQLQQSGGSRVLAVLHPEYQTFDKLAKLILREDSQTKELLFDEGNEEDFRLITSAIEGGASAGSWIGGLKLTSEVKTHLTTENKSSTSSGSEDEEEEVVEKSLKEKKCWVVGRWCGRVWRYDQAHVSLGGSIETGIKTPENPEVSSKRKASSDEGDEELRKRNEELANLAKNCRKKRRTHIWRMDSDDLTGASEAQSIPSQKEGGESQVFSTADAGESRASEPEAPEGNSDAAVADKGHLELNEEKQETGVEAGEEQETFVEAENDDSSEKQESSGVEPGEPEPESAQLPFEEEKPGFNEELLGTETFFSENARWLYPHQNTGVELELQPPRASEITWHEVPITFSTTLSAKLMGRDRGPEMKPELYVAFPGNKTKKAPESEEDEPQQEEEAPENEQVEEKEASESEDQINNRTRVGKKRKSPEKENDRQPPRKSSRKCTGTTKASIETKTSTPIPQKNPVKLKKPEPEQPEQPEKPEPEPEPEPEVYPCDFEGCTMSFGTEDELSLHRRNICTVKSCRKRLCSHSYLMQHYRVHVDERPLKCPWKGCKKSFKWSWARTEHIRVHTGERPYVCGDCNKCYRFVSDFSRHKRSTGHSA